MDYFKNNPRPSDKDVHDFAESEGIDEHKFEEIIYEIMGTFFGAGLAKDYDGSYDAKQLEMGIKVEMEHTSCKLISTRIAMDHLAECADYYTRLAKLEAECEGKDE